MHVNKDIKVEEILKVQQSNEDKISDLSKPLTKTSVSNDIICDRCAEKFENIATLNSHKSNDISKMAEADYYCNLCGKKFNCKTAKIQHIFDVHGYFKDIISTFQFKV